MPASAWACTWPSRFWGWRWWTTRTPSGWPRRARRRPLRVPLHRDAAPARRRHRRARASARDLLMPAAARALVETLVAVDVEHLFTLSGNQILSEYDAAIGRPLALYHTRHEAAAVHMADACGLLTERPGVA